MTVVRGQAVLTDTNAIIESFRVNGWKALASGYSLHTVETCCGEAGWGDPRQPGYVPVDVALLRSSATINAVSAIERATLDTRLNDPSALDPGERDLLAHLLSHPNTYAVCSPDKACLRAGNELGLLDRFATLEDLFSVIGQHLTFRKSYTSQWMSQFRTRLVLESAL
jgi:hypothetical protein